MKLNRLRSALISASLTALLVLTCSLTVGLGPRVTDDTRFVRTGSNIGRSAKELIKEIGRPTSTGDCSININSNDRNPTSIKGQSWIYRAVAGKNQSYKLSLCVIKGVVVAEIKAARVIENNSILRYREDLTTNLDLVRQLSGNSKRKSF